MSKKKPELFYISQDTFVRLARLRSLGMNPGKVVDDLVACYMREAGYEVDELNPNWNHLLHSQAMNAAVGRQEDF